MRNYVRQACDTTSVQPGFNVSGSGFFPFSSPKTNLILAGSSGGRGEVGGPSIEGAVSCSGDGSTSGLEMQIVVWARCADVISGVVTPVGDLGTRLLRLKLSSDLDCVK